MLEIGTLYDGKFTVEKILGQGGFGCVYQVLGIDGGCYALKICLEQEQEIVKRFKREIRMLKTLSSDRIITICHDGEAGGFFYYTMPIADGNLSGVQNRIQGDELKCLEVFKEICLGILDLHLNGLIHRDIKPENVLLWKNKVLISDLGLGKFENRDSTILTASDVYMGSVGYIPPEFQYVKGATKNASFASDIFQLGKLLYAIYTGENPVVVNDAKLPLSIATILNRTIAPQPEKRIQSTLILIQQVEKFILQLTNPDPDLKFYSELEKAKSSLSNFRYENTNLKNLLECLQYKSSNPVDFYYCFNQLPDQLLVKFVSDFFDDFQQIIEFYNKVLLSVPEINLKFEDIDVVSNRLVVVYTSCKSLDVKAEILKTLASLATEYNRFYAMGIVKDLIKKATDQNELTKFSTLICDNAEKFQYLELEDVRHAESLLKAFQSIQIDKKENGVDFLFE